MFGKNTTQFDAKYYAILNQIYICIGPILVMLLPAGIAAEGAIVVMLGHIPTHGTLSSGIYKWDKNVGDSLV